MKNFAPETLDSAFTWADRAACRGRSVNDFFTTDKRRVEQIKNVCASCEVRNLCLDEALRAEDTSRYGIYGGLTAAERDELVRTR